MADSTATAVVAAAVYAFILYLVLQTPRRGKSSICIKLPRWRFSCVFRVPARCNGIVTTATRYALSQKPCIVAERACADGFGWMGVGRWIYR